MVLGGAREEERQGGGVTSAPAPRKLMLLGTSSCWQPGRDVMPRPPPASLEFRVRKAPSSTQLYPEG
ncbi:hypothetical protein E2C01_081780 [Portunus trituberculatus]|uniref:Uncharacterized protein n=1 Tax=Portunus trituberculatus TaxID=210409 RepID=A0A5B7J215_PORTR|nr:hypothetical protein [Portunus trituberculatus]